MNPRRWRRSSDARRRTELLLQAAGWLEPGQVADWSHRVAHEALEHPALGCARPVSGRFSAGPILPPWAILRGRALEADPALSGALHAARDELDPCAVPAEHERAADARARRAAWEARRRRLVGQARP